MRHAELYQRLLEIPEDRYLLHGSPHKLETIEPRKADFEEKPAFDQLGVYATNCIDIAFLYALIHGTSSEWGYLTRTEEPFLDVRVPPLFVPNPGFIHVVPRDGFEQLDIISFITRKPVHAVEILPVDAEVLWEMMDKNTIDVWHYDPASA